MSAFDDVVPGVSVADFNESLRERPCPKCSQTGGLSVAWKFLPAPLDRYSLPVAQAKISAKRVLVASCSLCGAQARATPVQMPRS